MKALVFVFALSLAAIASALAPAQAQTQRDYAQLQTTHGTLFPAQSVTIDGQTYGVDGMSTEQMIAIGVGALVGLTVAQTVDLGLIGSAVGLVAGGMLGNWWFDERLPPFGSL